MDCQHEGGSCELFFVCWMSGGLLQGSCDGLMQGCCHRTAKATNRGAEAGKTFDLTDLPTTDYGPVVNDASECIDLLLLSLSLFYLSITLSHHSHTLFRLPLSHSQVDVINLCSVETNYSSSNINFWWNVQISSWFHTLETWMCHTCDETQHIHSLHFTPKFHLSRIYFPTLFTLSRTHFTKWKIRTFPSGLSSSSLLISHLNRSELAVCVLLPTDEAAYSFWREVYLLPSLHLNKHYLAKGRNCCSFHCAIIHEICRRVEHGHKVDQH